MASVTIKEILLKWNIDTSDWKKAIRELSDLMDRANDENARAQKEAKERLDDHKDAVKETVAAQKEETNEIRNQAAALKQKTAAAQAAKAETLAQIAQQKLLQQEINTRLMNEKLLTAELNKQSAALRTQMTQQRAAGGGPGGGGRGGAGRGGFLEGLTGGFGSKFAGTMTFAVTAGELLKDTLEHIAGSLKRLIEESDRFSNVWRTFDQLATRMGQDPAKMMAGLQQATHGLVGSTQLASESIRVMMQDIPISSSEIRTLTGDVADLARVQGGDASVAMAALNRGLATGRLNMVAYQLGLENTLRDQLTLTSQLPASSRALVEYGLVADAVRDKLEQTGRPIETLGTAIQRMGVAWGDFLEDTAKATVATTGAKDLEAAIDDLSSALGRNRSLVEDIASTIGNFLSVMAALVKAAKALGSALNDLNNMFVTLDSSTSEAEEDQRAIASIVAFAVEAWRKLGIVIRLHIQQTKDYLTLDFSQALKDEAQAVNDLEVATLAYLDTVEGLNDVVERSKRGQKPKGAPTPLTADGKALREKENALKDFQYNLRLDKERAEVQKLLGEQALANLKGNLDKEKELYSELYQHGAVSLQAFVAQQKKARTEETNLEITNLKVQEKAQEAIYNREQAIRGIGVDQARINLRQVSLAALRKPPAESERDITEAKKGLAEAEKTYKDAAAGREKIRLEFGNKELALINKLNQEQLKSDMELYKDQLAAYKATVSEMAKLDRDALSLRKTEVEDSFKKATISADEYLAARVKLIEEEETASRQAAERENAVGEDNEATRAQLQAKYAEAAAKKEQELTQLYLQQWDIRSKAAEDSYDRAQKLIDSQIEYQQATRKGDYFGGGREQESKLIEDQITLLKSKLEVETKALNEVKAGTEQWFQQYQRIMATNEALVKYNEELIKSRDVLTGMAEAVKEMQQAASRFPKVKGAEKVATGLGTLASGMGEMEEFRKRMAERAAAPAAKPMSTAEIFASLQKVSQGAGESLSKVMKDASGSIEEWRRTLTTSTDTYKGAIETTIAALSKLAAAIDKATVALMVETGAKSGRKYGTALLPPRMPTGRMSGAPTVEAPGGAITSSEGILTAPFNLTPGAGASPLEPQAEATAVALSKLQLATKSVEGGFQQFIKTSIGDDGLIGVFKNLGKNGEQASKDMSNFVSSIGQIAGGIGGLASAAKGTGGPFQAGMAGMAGGLQLGMTVGGPIGGAIGAGVGLVMGVFSGKAKKEAEKLAKDIMAEFNAVLEEVQQGTLGLGNAVTQEISIIQAAVSQLSGKKGGRDELKSILPAMEQQLSQLQAQQQQVIKSFDATMEQISAPEASRALVGPIQQIIQTYQQYVLAGGNVATANAYLQDSFKNLVEQGLDTLNQSEQDAVNNALNYNDLLLQRQQLIQDTNQQIQDVMSQGVAVRQMPQGVTKARQLEQIELGAQKQMAQLDQEIAVSQHKLQNESAIFQLATTRVGLETQLVALQDAQIDRQDAQTTALLGEVQAFSTMTPANLPTALGALGLPYISPATEPGLEPTPPVPTGIQWIDEQNQLAYQQALAYYNQQAGLSPTATLPSVAGTIPGGMQGVTVAGEGTAVGGTTQQIGGALDALASNIAAFPDAMSTALKTIALTVNNQQVDTVSTSLGTALVVSSASAGAGKSEMIDIGVAHAQGGAKLTRDQLLKGHKGELILPPHISKGLEDLINVGSPNSPQATSANAVVGSALQRHSIETQITSLSNMRVAQETQLVGLKMQEIQADMARMQAWSNLRASGGSQMTMEDMLQAVYQTRARQGFGGFNGEISNPL